MTEHHTVVAAFAERVAQFPADNWHRALGPGRWSAAAVALHVSQSYAFGVAAAEGGPGMRLRTHPLLSWLARRILLPRLLAQERFPRGAAAPAELRPDLERARRLSQRVALSLLHKEAAAALVALQSARVRPDVRITHAYFGPLSPLEALRLLSAHTRHHCRQLLP